MARILGLVFSGRSLEPQGSPREKFTRLRKLLKGKAAKVIGGFATTSANYSQALDLLFERYGRSHTIAQAHMQQIIDIPPPSSLYTSLEEFYDETETHIRGLEALGHSQDGHSGTLLAPLIINKLPDDVRQAMNRTNGSTEWTLPTVRAIFKRELEARRPAHSDGGSAVGLFVSNTSTRRPDMTRNGLQPYRQRTCIYCDDPSHSTFSCDKINDITRRKQIISEKRLCFNCMGKGHTSGECRNPKRCQKCKGKHHTSICTKTATQANVFNAQDSNFDPPCQEPSTDADDSDQVMETITFIEETKSLLLPMNGNGILLQTAVAPVLVNEEYINARILFDSGAQRTLVTQSFSTKAHAEVQGHESVTISGIEDRHSSKRRMPRVELFIKCQDDSRQPINALVLSTITAPLHTKNREVNYLSYLRDLPLAHPTNTNEDFEVDILIGNDHYWDFVQNDIIRGNGPTAMKSKLGYLISGPISNPDYTD